MRRLPAGCGARRNKPLIALRRAPQVSTTFVTCPAEATQTLGIKMPFLVMIIKNMRKYFSFEVTARPLCASQLRPRTPHAGAHARQPRAGDRR